MKNNNIYDIKELGFIPPKYGGVSVSIARLIDKLTEDGLLVGGFYSQENQDERVLQSPLFDPELNLSTKRFIYEYKRIKQILRPYRVLHSHYSLEHMIYMWSFVYLLHKPLVITVHNSMVKNFYYQSDAVNRFFLKRLANSSHVTWVAVSEQAKEEMMSLPVSFRFPIQVIPAYIPNEDVDTSTLPCKLQDYINRHNKNIVFYGHSFMLHEGRDVYGFVDALNLYAELLRSKGISIGLVLCLSDDKEKDKINELHNKAVALNIDDKIYWQIGPLDGMNPLLREADVYIRPTCTDGDSVAVREALDMGIQVVASDVCMRPNRTIVYKLGDMADFYSKVKNALTIQRVPVAPDYSNYIKIKEIYDELLKK